MTDTAYTAAQERARETHRAGLQAKKDEQPLNTTRSYAAKQREWRAWCSTPRIGPDGILSTWPDGELVAPDKLAAWLKEDILLRRAKIPKKRRGHGGGQPPLPAEDQAALREAEALATTLGLPLAEAVQILSDGRDSYVPPASIEMSTTWMPAHFKNICSVIDLLPSELNFDVLPLSEATGFSQGLGSWMQSDASCASVPDERAASR